MPLATGCMWRQAGLPATDRAYMKSDNGVQTLNDGDPLTCEKPFLSQHVSALLFMAVSCSSADRYGLPLRPPCGIAAPIRGQDVANRTPSERNRHSTSC